MKYAQHTLQIADLNKQQERQSALDAFTRYALAAVIGAGVVTILFNLN